MENVYITNLFSFSLIKGVLITMFIYYTNIFPNNLKTYSKTIILFNFIIFFFFTIIIQIHINYCNNYAIINLVMEQNLTIITVSFNGLLFYNEIFLNLILQIIIFFINIGLNNQNMLIVKYLTFSILLCIYTFIFIIIKFYISTLAYLENKKETENLKRKEKTSI